MKTVLNDGRCTLCTGNSAFKGMVKLSSGEFVEACWDCYRKESKGKRFTPGWVYIIGHGEFWKIGKTIGRPETRLIELQTGNPHALQVFDAWMTSDCSIAERFAHNALKKFHYRGEWFQGDPNEMVRLIKDWNPGVRN